MDFDTRAVQRAYETIADGYADTFGDDLEQSTFDRSVLDAVVDLLPPSALLLDIGCGPGQVASYVSERGCRSVGVDLTPEMLYIAHQRHPQLPLAIADVLQLPLPNDSVDGVIAWFSLHNLPRNMLSEALAEVRRVLRYDGVFSMVTHAGYGEESVEQNWRGGTEHVVITFYESCELRSALADQHLRTIDIRSRPPLSHERAVRKLFLTAAAQ